MPDQPDIILQWIKDLADEGKAVMLFILTSLKLLTLSLIAVVLTDKLMKYKLQK